MSKLVVIAPRLQFIGVACALGAPPAFRHPGPAAAPQVLHELGIDAAARRAGLDATWQGEIAGSDLAAVLSELAAACAASLRAGCKPVVIGGDHVIAAGTWRGVGRALGAAPGLIWIDAHLDAHTPHTSPTGNLHGMPLAALFGSGSAAMREIDGPPLDPARTVVIGVRSFEADEAAFLARLGVRVFDMDAIHKRGLAAVFADALAIAAADGSFGISLDLDALDPQEVAGVSTPVDDGLDADELKRSLRGLLRDKRCVALELAEYCPERDPARSTARRSIELLEAACLPDVQTLMRWEAEFGANNYSPLPVLFVAGQGCWLEDTAGRQYLDLMAAYSAVSFGHAHPRLVAALSAQAQRLAVTSRAVHNDRLPLLLRRLSQLTGYQRVLPVNTGLEAVETALKAARKWAYTVKGVAPDSAEIIACEGNFHGRSIAITGLSSEAQYRAGFGPFPPGTRLVPYGEAAALEAAITPNTAAFLVEPIQGEGGIILPPDGYLAACAEICRRHQVLLLADEVQTGLGRTGTVLACEHDGVRPDGVILGKALGGGLLPVSAFLADDALMQVFTPGDHGSTFGGNALAAAVALEALDLLIEGDLVAYSRALGIHLLARLERIAQRSALVTAVRGRGLFAGIEIDTQALDARALAEELLVMGVVSKDTHHSVLRLAPPLVIRREELDWGLDRIEELLCRLDATHAAKIRVNPKRA